MENVKFNVKEVSEKIQKKIETELLKRGFMAKIEIGFNHTKKVFTLKSEKFQTTPVLFKSIEIINFGGSVKESKNNKELDEVWIPVNVSYEHFDMGSNGCSLFNFNCLVNGDRIYSVVIN